MCRPRASFKVLQSLKYDDNMHEETSKYARNILLKTGEIF